MKTRFILITLIVAAFFLFAACSSDDPMIDANLDSAAGVGSGNTSGSENAKPTDDPLERIKEDAPLAVISTRSLRVRAEPSDTAKVIFAVKEREIFPVLAISADGRYIQLEMPTAPDGFGWVDANFVTMQGDITNIERGVLPSTPTEIALPTATPAGAIPAIVKTDGQRLRVRTEPNTDSAIAGRVSDGEQVNIIEQSEDGKWAKITAENQADPIEGWVAMEFLKLEK